MSEATSLILALPSMSGGNVHWCRVSNGAIIDAGEAEGLGDVRHPDEEPDRILLLLPPGDTHISFSQIDGLTGKQAESAARLNAADYAIGGTAQNHVATAHHDGHSIAATVHSEKLRRTIADLEAHDLSPDIILPAALVLPVPETGFVRGQLAGQAMLRSANMVLPDEEMLREHLVGDATVHELDAAEMETALLASLAAPLLNLRSGVFAKKRAMQGLGGPQIRTLAMLCGIILLLTLAIFGLRILKYNWGADLAEAEVLAAAQKQFPTATDLASAERLAGAELARRGLGDRIYSVPTSALFKAMQPVPNVAIRSFAFQPDGIISVELAGPRNEDLNQILVALQNNGYRVTVPPSIAQDATGAVVALITVRGS